MQNIIGHNKILKILEKAVAKNAVNHAYLFCGPEKAGKFTVALEFAKKLANSSESINPDIIIIKPETEEKKGIIKKRDIKIEQIRDLQHQLSLSSQGGKYKVAIIDEADRLNKMAQNALLRTLEEAGKNVVLILVSQDEKKMLPTILSRCQKIKFGIASNDELAKNIANEKDKSEILFWSLGCPGLMFDLINDEYELAVRRETLKDLKNLFSQNAADKFSMAEDMSKDINLTVKKLNLWNIILRESLLGRKADIKVDGEKALHIIDSIGKSLDLLKETNSNARLTLENLFLEF